MTKTILLIENWNFAQYH